MKVGVAVINPHHSPPAVWCCHTPQRRSLRRRAAPTPAPHRVTTANCPNNIQILRAARGRSIDSTTELWPPNGSGLASLPGPRKSAQPWIAQRSPTTNSTALRASQRAEPPFRPLSTHRMPLLNQPACACEPRKPAPVTTREHTMSSRPTAEMGANKRIS